MVVTRRTCVGIDGREVHVQVNLAADKSTTKRTGGRKTEKLITTRQGEGKRDKKDERESSSQNEREAGGDGKDEYTAN